MFVLCGDKMWLCIHLLAKEMNFVDFGKKIFSEIGFFQSIGVPIL